MKQLLFTTLFLITVQFANGQKKALTFKEGEAKGLTVEYLDKKYENALDADPSKAVFSNRSDDFINAYKLLLTDLGSFLKKENFELKKPTRVVHRIYFKKSGEIDYYLINLAPSGLDDKQQKQFLSILNKFVKTHKISITGNKDFAQCGPAVYQN